jgi:RNA polymerase sigma factor (sigma-70 family)
VDDVLSAPADAFAGVAHSQPDPSVLVEVTTRATASFVSFYGRERDGIARALTMVLGDADLAAEATDEAMARAYQRWPSVSGMESPGGWVFRVGLNWSRSWLRRRRRAPLPVADRDHGEHVASEPDVLVALAELDLPQRSVVVLRLYLGLSEAETAAALGIPAGTVKSRLHRATRILQVRLGHLRPDETATPRTGSAGTDTEQTS